MGSTYITDIELAVAGAGAFIIQPAAGHAYCLEEVSSNQAFVGGVPDVAVALDDGVHTTCILKLDPATAVQKDRKLEIYLTNALYATVTNTAVGAANIGYFGKQVNVNNVRSLIVTAPNGGNVDVQPPVGETWKVTEIGAETLGAAQHPNITMYLTNGVLTVSALTDETHNAKWDKAWNLILSNANYLNIAPIAAADNDVALSIVRVALQPFCGIVDCVGAATIDIQPAAGQQAVVVDIAGETWAGIAPVGTPDAAVALWDGVNISDVMTAGSVADALIHFRQMELRIHPAAYLRVTDVSGGANEIGWSGFVERQF